MSNVIEKVKAKVDAVLNKDTTTGQPATTTDNKFNHTDGNLVGNSAESYGNNTGGGLTGTQAGYSATGAAGHHHHHEHGHEHDHHHHHQAGTSGITGAGAGVGSTNAGPHQSNLMNKLDPRVDSDADGKNNMGMAKEGPGAQYNNASGPAPTTAGPHDHDLSNRMDPRYNATGQNAGVGNQQHMTGGLGEIGSGRTAGTTGGYGDNYNSGNGPHSSNLANKMDPRVDSTTGQTSAGTGNYGSTTTSGQGPHSSTLANKLDPRVDSTTGQTSSGTGQYGNNSGTYGDNSGTYGSNTGGHTGQPHSSNLLNKLDPTVDSSNTGYNSGVGGGRY